jgi:hypothetical protein
MVSSLEPASEVWSLATSRIGDRECGVCIINIAHDERLLEGGEDRGVEIISIDERFLVASEEVGVPMIAMIQSPQAQEGWCIRGGMMVLIVEGVQVSQIVWRMFATTAGLS